ncbi:putative protein kinase RLK-Pelle-LRR-IX family [Helianthus debilis subsp. tardiflorus]
MEYLHTLAHLSFKHRDLKSSNLLGDDFRAKVSDFGLVKLLPDGGMSIMTQVVGMFGYVTPEYVGHYLFSLYILWTRQKGRLETINNWHGSSKDL